MTAFHTLYNRIFIGFLLLVVGVFLYLKIPGGKSQLFIHGDGLGYYSYLPATFIYDDTKYEFKWFNNVYHRYYGPGMFENPEDNFMVDYEAKRINKYYQGLSFLWLPFFGVAHLMAVMIDAPSDGFSWPYQLAVGLASLFYLLAGLFYLRKLLLLLFGDQFAALIIPAAVIFGSHLFSFAFNVNSHTHVYSFTFVVVFIYYIVKFSKVQSNKLFYLMCALFAFFITICIRPLNGMILLAAPAFVSLSDLRLPADRKFSRSAFVVLLVTIVLCIYQLFIIYRQTGAVLVYTYTDERFYLGRSRFFDALFSYHMGLFLYVPVFFLSFFGITYLPKKQRIILPLLFFTLVFIYASWWFWPIVKRGMIDFYVLPSIFLGALLSAGKSNWYRWITGTLVILCILWYQFRHYQISVGALDEWQTTKESFWRNFWRTERAQMYHVPMSSVINSSSCEDDFETPSAAGGTSNAHSVSGKAALLIDQNNYIAKMVACPYPEFFKNDAGMKKVRVSFHAYFEGNIEALHVFLQIRDKEGKTLKEIAFYINKELLWFNKWDYSEYGCEIDPAWFANVGQPLVVEVVAWNVKTSGKAYIDDVNLEFFQTDRSFETIK